ncbi:uncharacterized protein BJ212DRAFT_1301971 [Suillus subaureus]|uniref:Uncharacterized protein n=1 Tax=Suillus subaureus TaxID=48587 RepID=A0A9P7E557_9AGAM|nr:uncharacterized protein BJ212DRAFT_1301971 [Suillus subaureus]KAG1811455.1 hypothetical protein BJ212DRAFT_1301971 [Suillus subaureus]
MPPATKCLLVSATSSSTIGDNDGGSDDDNDISMNKDESFVADSGDEEAKEAEEAYQQIKAFRDADRDEKGHKNAHTGESEDGWWCNICNNPNCHFPIYKSHCKEKGIIMHECTIPLNVKFSKSGLVDYIVKLIIAEDEAFQLVNKGSFHHLLQYLQPSLSDQEPH